ncbi:MAG: hypothetical protein NTV34_01830 [Proteobacteria bacterium]|nr:hypothetical protein [Pseudomonadota bacterium]
MIDQLYCHKPTRNKSLNTVFYLVVGTFVFMRSSWAASPPMTTTNARWEQTDKIALVINVADLLTPAQRDIINSGFTTFTMLSIGGNNDSGGETPLFRRSSCTVKYDTWEERYEVTRLDPPPPTSITVKGYRDWSQDCLEVTLSNSKILTQLNQMGTISAYLVVRQSTSDESGRIKNWLVKQQSGFMQGLYSHMLGDFQYQNQTRIKIVIPKKVLGKELRGEL